MVDKTNEDLAKAIRSLSPVDVEKRKLDNEERVKSNKKKEEEAVVKAKDDEAAKKDEKDKK